MAPRTQPSRHETGAVGGLRGRSAARETCLGHSPLASVFIELALQKRELAGAGAAASWRLAGSVEHSFRCVLQLDSAKTEVPVGWQRCREEPICLRRNLAARKGARDTLTARSKTENTPL